MITFDTMIIITSSVFTIALNWGMFKARLDALEKAMQNLQDKFDDIRDGV